MYKEIRVAIAVSFLFSFKALLLWSEEPSFAQTTSDWIHTTYSNGVTTIAVAEKTEGSQYYNAYRTVVAGKPIFGRFHFDHIHHGKTYTELSGSFQDVCMGEINIRRPNRQSGLPIVAQVTWVVTGQAPLNYLNKPQNHHCNVPAGQQFQLDLPEALPKPDRRGEFTNATSNTFFGEGAFYTWSKWQVLSADGELNCRVQPNGAIQHTYRKGEIIGKLGRERLDGNNLVELPNGSSWLRTKQRCYVRASDRYLKPVALPTKNW